MTSIHVKSFLEPVLIMTIISVAMFLHINSFDLKKKRYDSGNNEFVTIIAYAEDVLLKRASQGKHMAQSKITKFLKSI